MTSCRLRPPASRARRTRSSFAAAHRASRSATAQQPGLPLASLLILPTAGTVRTVSLCILAAVFASMWPASPAAASTGATCASSAAPVGGACGVRVIATRRLSSLGTVALFLSTLIFGSRTPLQTSVEGTAITTTHPPSHPSATYPITPRISDILPLDEVAYLDNTFTAVNAHEDAAQLEEFNAHHPSFAASWQLTFIPDNGNPSVCDDVPHCTKLYVAEGTESDYSACFAAAPSECGYTLIATQTTSETFDLRCGDVTAVALLFTASTPGFQTTPNSTDMTAPSRPFIAGAYSFVDLGGLYLSGIFGPQVSHKVNRGSLNIQLSGKASQLCNYEAYTTPTDYESCKTVRSPPSDAITVGLTTVAQTNATEISFPYSALYNPHVRSLGVRPKDGTGNWSTCGSGVSSVTSEGVQIAVIRTADRINDEGVGTNMHLVHSLAVLTVATIFVASTLW